MWGSHVEPFIQDVKEIPMTRTPSQPEIKGLAIVWTRKWAVGSAKPRAYAVSCGPPTDHGFPRSGCPALGCRLARRLISAARSPSVPLQIHAATNQYLPPSLDWSQLAIFCGVILSTTRF